MDVEDFVGLVALAAALICVASGVYVYNVYRQRNEEALFLDRLVRRDLRVALASAAIAFVVAYSYLVGTLPRPMGAVIIGVALLTMMYGPISDALLWRKERKR